jgi:hypothetical protein
MEKDVAQGELTEAEQIVAADPSQLRSFLTPLLRAAELKRSAGARSLAAFSRI